MNGRKPVYLVLALVAGCILIVVALMLFGKLGFAPTEPTVVEGPAGDVVIDGEAYNRRSLTKVLLIVSHADIDEKGVPQTSNSEASALALIAFDNAGKTYSVLHIDPDTYARFRLTGNTDDPNNGYTSDRIALAQTYGNSLNQNSRNTLEAVSELLYRLEINYFICFNQDEVAVTDGRIAEPEKVLAEFCTVMLDEEAQTLANGSLPSDSLWLATNASLATLSRFSKALAEFGKTGAYEFAYDRMEGNMRRVAIREDSRKTLSINLYYERVRENE